MKVVSEKELREAIRFSLAHQEEPKKLNEVNFAVNVSAGEFYQALIEPWINVLKLANVEAQKMFAEVLNLFRVMTTFNGSKLRDIRAKHKDRKRKLNQKTSDLLSNLPLNADMALAGFFLNPGAAIYAVSPSGDQALQNVADWFEEAGWGDVDPRDFGSKSAALDRDRERAGLVSKALTGLQRLFIAGYSPSGNIIAEQEEIDQEEVQLSAQSINDFIESMGGMPDVEEAREELLLDSEELLKDINSAKQIVELLGSLTKVQNLDQYMQVLDQITKISPETGTPARAQLEQALENDAKSIASQEGAREEAAKSFLMTKGNNQPSEEDLSEVTEEQIDNQIRSVAFGNILARLRKAASDSAVGIYEERKETYDVLYPEDLDPKIKQIVDESEFGDNMAEVGKKLQEIDSIVKTLGV